MTKGHSGYYGCPNCCIEGAYIGGKVVFPDSDCPLRTDASFRQQHDSKHHRGTSILVELPLDTMSYAIVEFTASKEVEIVPTTWVTGSMCVWPHNVKVEKAGKMARKQHLPQSWWKLYEIAVKGLFVTYEHARKKLNDSQFHSDLARETQMPPLKRRRRPPAAWSNSDSEEKEEETATSQPGLPAILNNSPSGITSNEATSLPTFGQGDKGTPETQLSETNSPQGMSDNHSVDAGMCQISEVKVK
nr:uncharacterized protein LOC126544211 [Dermacentor andersoni]